MFDYEIEGTTVQAKNSIGSTAVVAMMAEFAGSLWILIDGDKKSLISVDRSGGPTLRVSDSDLRSMRLSADPGSEVLLMDSSKLRSKVLLHRFIPFAMHWSNYRGPLSLKGLFGQFGSIDPDGVQQWVKVAAPTIVTTMTELRSRLGHNFSIVDEEGESDIERNNCGQLRYKVHGLGAIVTADRFMYKESSGKLKLVYFVEHGEHYVEQSDAYERNDLSETWWRNDEDEIIIVPRMTEDRYNRLIDVYKNPVYTFKCENERLGLLKQACSSGAYLLSDRPRAYTMKQLCGKMGVEHMEIKED